jgi:hypothetical protein
VIAAACYQRVMKLSLVASLAIALVGCSSSGGSGGGSGAPRMTAALMPPGTEGLVLGASTEADVKAKLPGAKIEKDKSLGGDMVVQFNEHPAETLSTEGLSMTLWRDAGGTLRLTRIHAFSAGRCAWLKQAIASVPGAATCRGSNRVSGDRGHEMFYCLATADGAHPVWVECSRDTPKVGGGTADELELWID